MQSFRFKIYCKNDYECLNGTLCFVFVPIPTCPEMKDSGAHRFQIPTSRDLQFLRKIFIRNQRKNKLFWLKINLESLQIYKKLFHKKRKEDTKFHKANEFNLSGLKAFSENIQRNQKIIKIIIVIWNLFKAILYRNY